jgi:hypothetical protein
MTKKHLKKRDRNVEIKKYIISLLLAYLVLYVP